MAFIRINDLTLHYRRDGDTDGKPLVFINSLGTDYRIWDAVVPHFASNHAVLRYDKRGHGLTDVPAPPYTIADHTADLVALLDALDIAESIIIGLSVGGMIAIDFAARYPQRVTTLVLCDTAPQIGTAAMWKERIDTLRAQGMTHLRDSILARWFAPDFKTRNPAAYHGYGNMLIHTPLDGYTGTCEAIRDADLIHASRQIRAKTLVLCGEQDVSTPPDFVREATIDIPDAHFDLIPYSGHLPCVEQPDTLAAKISTFLEDA